MLPPHHRAAVAVLQVILALPASALPSFVSAYGDEMAGKVGQFDQTHEALPRPGGGFLCPTDGPNPASRLHVHNT